MFAGEREERNFPRPRLRRPGELLAHVENPAAILRPGVEKSLLIAHDT
jgi:hypothetical protein